MEYSANLKSDSGFRNNLSKRANGSAVVAVDGEGLFGFLPGENKPYMPVGGRKVLVEIKDILIFKCYDFGSTCTIKRGRKL